MADHFDALFFQIGDRRYCLTSKNINGAPIYQSSRSIDRNDNNCLWLYKSRDGHWISTEAPKDCIDLVHLGQLKFRTFKQVQNIEYGQWTYWQVFDARRLRWKGKRCILTHPATPNALKGREALAAMLARLEGPVPTFRPTPEMLRAVKAWKYVHEEQ